jgi:hypothetical protein
MIYFAFCIYPVTGTNILTPTQRQHHERYDAKMTKLLYQADTATQEMSINKSFSSNPYTKYFFNDFVKSLFNNAYNNTAFKINPLNMPYSNDYLQSKSENKTSDIEIPKTFNITKHENGGILGTGVMNLDNQTLEYVKNQTKDIDIDFDKITNNNTKKIIYKKISQPTPISGETYELYTMKQLAKSIIEI